MPDKYTIRDGVVEPAADLLDWSRWFETADRHVATDQIGACYVSTVFLGLNHRFGAGEPLLFETMIFTDDTGAESWCDRCSTLAEARAMHERGCMYAREQQALADAALSKLSKP
jgi:hypothetical protein